VYKRQAHCVPKNLRAIRTPSPRRVRLLLVDICMVLLHVIPYHP
jgi:hypothetical protein